MAIKKPQEMDFSNKKFTMIIAGSPGLGKTTLALSAPNPMLFDFDKGVSRIRSEHRTITSECETYEDFLTDLKTQEYSNCKTVVIDTGGSLVQLMKPWAKKQDKRAATNGMAMFGVIKQEFDRLTWQIRNDGKNCVVVFHTTEVIKGEITTTRLSCEGSAKDIVWTPADLGGNMFMQGKKRIIGFTPCEEYFAKGCFGVQGLYEIPELTEGKSNTFLTDLFDKARSEINAEAAVFAVEREKYNSAMEQGKMIISVIEGAESATQAIAYMAEIEQALTSKVELMQLLKNKTDSLGLKWNKEVKRYEPMQNNS